MAGNSGEPISQGPVTDDTGMLRGQNGQTVADIDTLAPMTDDEESAAQSLYGSDYRRWPTLQQQQWLRRFPEDERQAYIDSRTWGVYQVRLNNIAAGLGVEEEEQAIRELEALTPMTEAEREWTANKCKTADPDKWPALARRRHIRGLDRSQWAAELARTEPAAPPAQRRTPCHMCQQTRRAGYCDADPAIGIGCSECRQRKRRCVCNGVRMVDRPAADRDFRLKCQNCKESGEDCEWLAAAINLHYACGNCTRKGWECKAQEGSPPEVRMPPSQGKFAYILIPTPITSVKFKVASRNKVFRVAQYAECFACLVLYCKGPGFSLDP